MTNKLKSTLMLLSALTLSGCAGFDMDMLNPFSSTEENKTEMMAMEDADMMETASEEQIQMMYRDWTEMKPELMRLFALDAEVNNLKQQLSQQEQHIKALESSKGTMMASTESKTKSMMMAKHQGMYSIQIAAASTMDAAKQAWQTQRRKYMGFLSDLSPTYKKLMRNNTEFYRVKVGSYNTNSQAVASCRTFQNLGGQCVVRKN